jgi:hypothetical protein
MSAAGTGTTRCLIADDQAMVRGAGRVWWGLRGVWRGLEEAPG